MKFALNLFIALLATCYVWSDNTPYPPKGAVLTATNPVPSSPVGAFTPGLKSVVTTNAVSSPQGFFPVAYVYNSAGLLGTSLNPTNAVVFTWQANTETDIDHYSVYRGDITSQAPFAKYNVPKTTLMTLFTGLDTNIVYGFFVTAINTSGQESAPSALVILKPGSCN